jgi:hypothetical protein
MCTYATEQVSLTARARTERGWQPAARATVYFDHPVAFPAGHSLNVDIFSDEEGTLTRVAALELDPRSARALATAILRLLAATPPELLDEPASPRQP